jgi:hypothetical protein
MCILPTDYETEMVATSTKRKNEKAAAMTACAFGHAAVLLVARQNVGGRRIIKLFA